MLMALLPISACSIAEQPTVVPTKSPSITPTPHHNREGILQLVYHEAPTMLNPYLATANKDIEVSRIFYEPLATVLGDNRLLPVLATEIPSVENGGLAQDLSWVIWKIKRDIRWADGQAFTAQDVKFTYDYVTNPGVGASYISFYSSVKSVDVLDEYTVRVNFKGATPGWSVPFVGKAGMILPRHVFGSYAGTNAQDAPANRHPVGTGPYRMLGEIKPQETLFLGSQLVETNKITCEPNPYYRAPEKIAFHRLNINGGGTVNQALRMVLENQTADYAYLVEVDEQQDQAILSRGYGTVVSTTGGSVLIFVPNFTDPSHDSVREFQHPVLSDLLVRQALAHAIDRERIVREVYAKSAVVESNYIFTAHSDMGQAIYPFDLKAAAALLDQAGWVDSNNDGIREKDGQPLRLIYQTAISPQFQKVLKIISNDLESIGFNITPDIKDPNVYFGNSSNPNSYIRFQGDLASYAWFFDSHNELSKLAYWTCSAIPTPTNSWAGYNAMRWCQPDFDQLLSKAEAERDDSARQQLIQQMNTMLIKDVAMVVIAQLSQQSAVSSKLKGFAPTPWDAETWNIQDWNKVDSYDSK